jgi:hypothetical protein
MNKVYNLTLYYLLLSSAIHSQLINIPLMAGNEWTYLVSDFIGHDVGYKGLIGTRSIKFLSMYEGADSCLYYAITIKDSGIYYWQGEYAYLERGTWETDSIDTVIITNDSINIDMGNMKHNPFWYFSNYLYIDSIPNNPYEQHILVNSDYVLYTKTPIAPMQWEESKLGYIKGKGLAYVDYVNSNGHSYSNISLALICFNDTLFNPDTIKGYFKDLLDTHISFTSRNLPFIRNSGRMINIDLLGRKLNCLNKRSSFLSFKYLIRH